jgi:hypothetical protein
MSTNSFDIGRLFGKAFGYQPPDNFHIDKQVLDITKTQFQIPDAGSRVETSKKGLRYYAEDSLGREFFLPVWIDGYLVPFAVIGINCSKTIISTSLPEIGGSVKELISIDDYKINIKGMCVSQGNEYPEDDIQKLFNLFKKGKSLIVESVLTAIFLDGKFHQKCVIRDLKFPQLAGVEHVKPFELELESDMIFALDIKTMNQFNIDKIQ